MIVAALALACYEGWRAGFAATMFGIGTWLIGVLVAAIASGALQPPLTAITGIEATPAHAVLFIAVLVAVEGAFVFLGRFALRPLQSAIHPTGALRVADKVAGVVPSALRMLVLLALVTAVLDVYPTTPGVRDAIESSRLGKGLVTQVEALQPALAQLFGGDQGVLLVTKVSADEQQRLQLPDGLQPTADPEAEQQLFDLVNQERTSRGLGALTIDARLVPVARAHAAEMFQLKYFGHISPVTGSPFDRLKAAGITDYIRAGENLAYAQSVAIAHQGLMNSEAHRENILKPEYTKIGIGVESAGLYGKMFTQLFLSP